MNTDNHAAARTAEAKREAERIWTVSHFLTAARVVLVAPFVYLVVVGMYGWALAAFMIAGLTDFFDGYLARKLNQQSSLGRLLDPAADKLLTTASYIVLAMPREGQPSIPIWLAAIVISRDLLILLGSFLIYSRTRYSGFSPTLIGKATFLGESMVVAVFLAAHAANLMLSVLPALYLLVALSALASGIQYLIAGVRILRRRGASSR
jgi:cardiolipin synthase